MKKIFSLLITAFMGFSINFQDIGHNCQEEQHEHYENHEQYEQQQYKDPETIAENMDLGANALMANQTPTSNNVLNRIDYFKNLTKYSPINNIGSCGFVSLIQLMSYYDSLENDDIIPEIYDRNDGSKASFEEAIKVSPGVVAESHYDLGYTQAQYKQYVEATQHYNFQSRLTIIYNEILPGSTYNYSIGMWNYQTVLNGLYGNSTFVQVDQYQIPVSDSQLMSVQPQYESYIKAKIDLGIPVVVHISNGTNGGGHSVVAYEYDSSGIYANFGWGSSYSHTEIFSKYPTIYRVASLEFSQPHVHSNNYVIDDVGYCGCWNVTNPRVKGLHYSTFPIKYVWTGLEATDTYELIFLDNFNNIIARFPGLLKSEYTLIPDMDSDVENEYISVFYETTDIYGIMVAGYSNGSTVPIYYSDIVYYEVPPAYYGRTYRSQDYRNSFAEQYFFDERVAEHHNFFAYGHVNNWDTYYTRRLRTATIDNKYVVLSPRKANAGLAFIEYEFGWCVETLEIELGLWSDSELLRASDCTALVQYKSRDGSWVTLLDLLNDVQLPAGKDSLKTFILNIPERMPNGQYEVTTSIRVISTAPAIGASKNTGRLVVGDISIYQAY